MSHITFSEDLIGILIVAGIIISFVVVLGNSYSNYQEQKSREEKNQLLLRFFDFLRSKMENNSTGGISFGKIKKETISENIYDILPEKIDLKNIRIDSENRTLFKLKKENEKFDQSVILPIIYENKSGKTPAKLKLYVG